MLVYCSAAGSSVEYLVTFAVLSAAWSWKEEVAGARIKVNWYEWPTLISNNF